MELGCDPRGYSRAGYDTVIWYCAIAVGRPSVELNKMREVCIYIVKMNCLFLCFLVNIKSLVFSVGTWGI